MKLRHIARHLIIGAIIAVAYAAIGLAQAPPAVVQHSSGPNSPNVVQSSPAKAPQPKPDQSQQLTQAPAQCTDDLGAANTKLGPLQRMQALAQAGQLVSPQQIIAAIERANGFKLGADLKIVQKSGAIVPSKEPPPIETSPVGAPK